MSQSNGLFNVELPDDVDENGHNDGSGDSNGLEDGSSDLPDLEDEDQQDENDDEEEEDSEQGSPNNYCLLYFESILFGSFFFCLNSLKKLSCRRNFFKLIYST